VDLSLGHDEYLYHVVRDYLPEKALYMIPLSLVLFGAREGEYEYLMAVATSRCSDGCANSTPMTSTQRVRERPNVEELRPYYEDFDCKILSREIELVNGTD